MKSYGKMIALVLALLSFHAEAVEICTDLHEVSCQTMALEATATSMGIDLTTVSDFPEVVIGEAVDLTAYVETIGFVPHVVVNHYHWKANKIFLSDTARFDTLVHEYVHFFQFRVKGYDEVENIDVFAEDLELEAVMVQDEYR